SYRAQVPPNCGGHDQSSNCTRRAEGCQCSSDYERLGMTETKRPKKSSLVRTPRGRGATARSSDQEVMLHLSRSQIFKDYEQAFSEAVDLPLKIRAQNSWSPAHHLITNDDSFAAILARFNQARAACLRAQTDASQELASTTRT